MTPRRTGSSFGRLILVLASGALAASTLGGSPPSLETRLKEMSFRLETSHYLLLADVKAVPLDRFGEALEKMYKEYEAGFGELLKQKKFKQGRFTVVFFAVKADYDRFGDDYLGGETKPTAGMFVPRANLLAIHDQGGFDQTCHTVFHEAFHQFMHRYIPGAPTWLNEGLADYYGNARVTDAGLSFSKPPANPWELMRKAIAQRKFVPLAELVSFSQDDFYRPDPVQLTGYPELKRRNLCYTEAYTLMHLLLSDAGGRERVRTYIADLAAAKSQDYEAVTRKHFGPDTCEYLTPHWIKHVNSRPEQK